MNEQKKFSNFIKESNEDLKLSDIEKYYIIKDNIVYKTIIVKRTNDILISIKNYIIELNLKEIYTLLEISFNSINEAFEYFINLFDENKVSIQDIIHNKLIKLQIKKNETKDIKLNLLYNKQAKKNYLYNLKQLYDNIKILKEEINNLKQEIKQLKKINDNPKNIKIISEVTKDSYANVTLDNSFVVFKSIYNILYLIYSSNNKSIISYDLENKKKICEIKSFHTENINNFRHYLDENNKRDLILSLSNKEINLKIWNLYNWECLVNIFNVYDSGYLFSACLLKDNNEYNIITCNCNLNGDSEPIKIFDFNGQLITNINESNELTYFIDVYYAKKNSKKYIITGNDNYIKTYDYDKKKLYHKYSDDINEGHQSIVINDNNNIIQLIESSFGIIRVWDFHSGRLLNKIKTGDEDLRGICLWNKDYIFVGCYDNTIKLIDLQKGKVIKNLTGHNNYVITIKKINHPIYGDCLISQGWKKDQIKIWATSN